MIKVKEAVFGFRFLFRNGPLMAADSICSPDGVSINSASPIQCVNMSMMVFLLVNVCSVSAVIYTFCESLLTKVRVAYFALGDFILNAQAVTRVNLLIILSLFPVASNDMESPLITNF